MCRKTTKPTPHLRIQVCATGYFNLKIFTFYLIVEEEEEEDEQSGLIQRVFDRDLPTTHKVENKQIFMGATVFHHLFLVSRKIG